MRTIETHIADYQLTDIKPLEIAVLAGIVADTSLLVTAKENLREDDFHSDATVGLWRLLNGMVENHEPINVATLTGKGLANDDIVALVGCSDAPFSTVGMESACRILRNASVRREAYFTAVELLRATTDSRTTDQDIYSFAERISNAVTEGSNDSDVISVREAFDELEGEVRARKDGRLKPIPTGLNELDGYLLGGYEPGELVILAARPSVGKTAVMLQIALKAAKEGTSTAVFSLEMSNRSLAKRLAIRDGAVRSWELSSGSVSMQDFRREASKYKDLPLYLCDAAFSLESLEGKITRAHQRGLCDVAFIDYLGLIGGMKGMSLYQQVTDTTRKLKMLAKRLDIPVILLAQLNRSSSSDNRSPELHDLRDSGSIEQDADIVIMLENPSRTTLDAQAATVSADVDDTELKRIVMAWLRKNRRGLRDVPVVLRATNGYTNFVEAVAHPEQSYIPEPVQAEIEIDPYEDED